MDKMIHHFVNNKMGQMLLFQLVGIENVQPSGNFDFTTVAHAEQLVLQLAAENTDEFLFGYVRNHFGYIFGLGKQKLYTRGTGFLFLDIFETPDLKKIDL